MVIAWQSVKVIHGSEPAQPQQTSPAGVLGNELIVVVLGEREYDGITFNI